MWRVRVSCTVQAPGSGREDLRRHSILSNRIRNITVADVRKQAQRLAIGILSRRVAQRLG